jgi:hypothetical protein
MITALRTVIFLPFRLVFWTFNALGRIASLVLGLTLMVGGAAFLAGHMVWLGAAVCLFGLYLSLRALG